jgi:BirA family biotin operon repressor/biotin-[acetyl-CoA-carboxylase] ligase
MDDKEAQPEFSVVWADYQSAGRGQKGNSWEGERDKNLLFSMVARPDFMPANVQFLVSQISSLSVKKALDEHISDVTVKWPNDIYWKDKKICGMLIENDLSGSTISRSIIGIGLNINQERFLSDAPNPVSLLQITGSETDRVEVLNSFIRYFVEYYSMLLDGRLDEIREEYASSLYRGKGFYPYEAEGKKFMAEISDIEPSGHLILRDDAGVLRRFAFKEVKTV